MKALILAALEDAMQDEIKHTYSVTSRDHPSRGGHAAAAEVLRARIDSLWTYHQCILKLLVDQPLKED